MNPLASEQDKAVGDLSLIAFYYILRQGEYCVKSTAPDKKQTVQFRVKDVTFFKRDVGDVLRKLPRNAPDGMLMCAESATMNPSNQKNGHKNVCINHASNGNKALCPFRALARRIVSIRKHSGNPSIFLSAYFQKGKRHDFNNNNISTYLKWGAAVLNYPSRGMPIDLIDTHSLR